MTEKYTTRRNASGNRKTLIIDHTARTYKLDYNSARDYSEYITIGARDRIKLAVQAAAAGYSPIQ
jgi:hypothetical protein